MLEECYEKISVGNQSFETIRQKDCFYVDKTNFISEWWESDDVVTLITRPRRFGKTLNMDMIKCFFQIAMRTGVTCLKDLIFGKKKNIENCREHIR